MLSARRIFRTNTDLDEATKIWLSVVRSISLPDGEEIPVPESLGRITAGAVEARISSPFYHASAMDGYAVRFHETSAASETHPVLLKLDEQAVAVNTGDPVPEGFNAVIMVEDVSLEDDCIGIISSVAPYQHVRSVGEDLVQTELILPENHCIRPIDIAAMLAGGNTCVCVRRMPLVTIIPTGNEIVEPGSAMEPGRIIDSNSFMIGSLVRQWGGEYRRTEVAGDNKELIKQMIEQASGVSDLIVVLSGASAGTRDFTPNAVDELGKILVQGINIKPGRPVLLGMVHNRPVIGLPGYPVAAHMTFELFGRPLINHLLGVEPPEPENLKAKLSRPVASSLGQKEFLRVKVGRVDGKYIATPVGRGAGAIMTLQRADGIVTVPQLSEGLAPDTEVDVQLIRASSEINNTVVCTGSHDNSLDVLSNVFRRTFPRYSMSSAHVGSMGGIMAIKRGETHIAGMHLLDENSSEYNVPFIRKFLKDIPCTLINLVYRQQGLIVPKGNPLGISDITDIAGGDLTFINRQPGSGTRLLTDKCLRDRSINFANIPGYDRDEYTHMGVASAVASGAADTGMGILAAAMALGLDFIPVAHERYDLLIRKAHIDNPMISSLIGIIRSEEFRDAVLSLGGYDVSDMGTVMYE